MERQKPVHQMSFICLFNALSLSLHPALGHWLSWFGQGDSKDASAFPVSARIDYLLELQLISSRDPERESDHLSRGLALL